MKSELALYSKCEKLWTLKVHRLGFISRSVPESNSLNYWVFFFFFFKFWETVLALALPSSCLWREDSYAVSWIDFWGLDLQLIEFSVNQRIGNWPSYPGFESLLATYFSCMTLIKSLSFSEPPFPHLQKAEVIILISARQVWELNEVSWVKSPSTRWGLSKDFTCRWCYWIIVPP